MNRSFIKLIRKRAKDMAGYEKITPEGTRDMLFEGCAVRGAVMEKLRAVFGGAGYREVSTPGFEFYDVFASGDKAEYYPQESMYKMTDARGRLVAVRPDNTIPIARMAASKLRGAPLPLKLSYAQQVFRRQQELSGRSAEVMQMGVELIGASGFDTDVDMLALAIKSLDAVAASPCRVEIGHVGIFNLLIDGVDASPEDRALIHRYISAKNYAALDDALDRAGSSGGGGLSPGPGGGGLLSEQCGGGLPSGQCGGAGGRAAEILRRLPRLFGGREALAEASELMEGYDDKLTEMLAYLERLFAELSPGDGDGRIMIDLGLVNQAEYYSSLVFKGYTEDTGVPVLSGGRYDDLLADFGEDLPATGFGLDIDALTASALRANSGAGKGGDATRGDGGLCENTLSVIASEAKQSTTTDVPRDRRAATPSAMAGEATPSVSRTPRARRLRVAVTKGRLERSFIELMEKAGYDCTPLKDKGRKLLIALPDANMEFFLAKAPDVITYVEHGVCDVGIVGKDTIAEQGGTYYEIMDLGIGKCRFALAAPKETPVKGGTPDSPMDSARIGTYGSKTIATKYPNVAERYFESKGMDVEVIKIEGSVEIAPLLGLADAIVDIVETGVTLEENGLAVIETIRDISARLIVNVTSMKLKKSEVDGFAARLAEVKG
jgi:ATP phosphoribosyltransferase regulatory subunit